MKRDAAGAFLATHSFVVAQPPSMNAGAIGFLPSNSTRSPRSAAAVSHGSFADDA